ncbi:multisubunit potassium/proton antiporter PhaF subunit [Rhodopseudomonas thermotolerans]|jgi:multicomponent K+:H+ antiporter subunit F|uniref:Multisubunit potassium/proton antiporter PhaF subunit n=2 Tax=Rhodopseudomonas TaxID=1073 RepID=A0A336JWE2_9BRAD|nr:MULTISPECIES: K+/H+ antiporter subunit F [Rhodopseudomonas]RED28100.1 multisubunit potassium/proton antiporter PhaF subunit [Rhodopseudomonas pentothenatexigens]REF91354.1 multisubunit potassium/proton antiporter PhaF subunit [Rhodopseudomonas thermotolerans]SSW92686.1 multisubunit potassium/proton antiporter PhaF subunit [Rhodopseudomonas pentothenatexigens]
MIQTACLVAIGAIAVSALLNLYRLAKGPDVLDRILALDTLVINTIGLVVVIGIWFGTTLYFEVALLFVAVGFLTTIAFCKYLLRGNVIE